MKKSLLFLAAAIVGLATASASFAESASQPLSRSGGSAAAHGAVIKKTLKVEAEQSDTLARPNVDELAEAKSLKQKTQRIVASTSGAASSIPVAVKNSAETESQ